MVDLKTHIMKMDHILPIKFSKFFPCQPDLPPFASLLVQLVTSVLFPSMLSVFSVTWRCLFFHPSTITRITWDQVQYNVYSCHWQSSTKIFISFFFSQVLDRALSCFGSSPFFPCPVFSDCTAVVSLEWLCTFTSASSTDCRVFCRLAALHIRGVDTKYLLIDRNLLRSLDCFLSRCIIRSLPWPFLFFILYFFNSLIFSIRMIF